MLSEDKTIHIVHLIIDGLANNGFATFPKKDVAVHEAKKTAFKYMSSLSEASEAARRAISSQRNAPPENSPQWDNLYQKYYEEELKKRGG